MTGEVDVVLDRHRDAEQRRARPAVAVTQAHVGAVGRRQGVLGADDAEGVQLGWVASIRCSDSSTSSRAETSRERTSSACVARPAKASPGAPAAPAAIHSGLRLHRRSGAPACHSERKILDRSNERISPGRIPAWPIRAKEAAPPIDRRRAPATRDAILRATLLLLAEEGTGALSNRRIAAEAKVSLGSLTYHFPSQAVLLRESLLLYVNEEVERLEAVAAALRARNPSPAEVAAEVETLIARPTGGPGPLAELELHLQAARDPELQEASRRCFAAYDALAADALATLGVPTPSGMPRRRRPDRRARPAPSRHRRHRSAEVTDALLTHLRGALAG